MFSPVERSVHVGRESRSEFTSPVSWSIDLTTTGYCLLVLSLPQGQIQVFNLGPPKMKRGSGEPTTAVGGLT